MLTDLDVVLAADREIDAALARVRGIGPDRVMISGNQSTSADSAAMAGILPDVVFIRSDGWTLGAPFSLANAAARQWARYWLAVFEPASDSLTRLNEEPFDAMLRAASSAQED